MSDVTTEPPSELGDSVPARGAERRPPGDTRRRLVRHYLPIAAASSLVLVAFMNLPFLDANRYPHVADIFTEGIKGAWDSGEPSGPMGIPGMEHGADQSGDPAVEPRQEPATPTTDPGEGQTGTPGMGHSGRPSGAGTDHGGGQSEVPATEPGGGRSVAPPTAEDGDMDVADHGDAGTARLMRKYTVATGYIALVLLGLTLLVGPGNLMLRRRTPLSSYVARDVGIWAAIASVAHVIFGFLVNHADGILGYFFYPGDRSRILTTSFGLANWTGLVAVVIIAILAVTSSDAALRKLKYRRWKKIQRLNYVLFALVIAHALLYGALWRLTSPYTALLGASLVAVLVAQIAGIRLWRRRNARKAAAATG
jgi:sulfoxide reductase heme-binding subunit YedZ